MGFGLFDGYFFVFGVGFQLVYVGFGLGDGEFVFFVGGDFDFFLGVVIVCVVVGDFECQIGVWFVIDQYVEGCGFVGDQVVGMGQCYYFDVLFGGFECGVVWGVVGDEGFYVVD